MARERPTYRLELERLNEMFPGKEVLTRTDVMQYTGRGRKWMDSHGFTGSCFTKVKVAALMAGLM